MSSVESEPATSVRADLAEAAFAAHRGGLQEMVVERARADVALAAGRQIVIFPEGTRVEPGVRAPLQPGIKDPFAAGVFINACCA